jgi:hypothetical protein
MIFFKKKRSGYDTGEDNALEANVSFNVTVQGKPQSELLRKIAHDYVFDSMNNSDDSPFRPVTLLDAVLNDAGDTVTAHVTLVAKGSKADSSDDPDDLVYGERPANVNPTQDDAERSQVLDKVAATLLTEFKGYHVEDIRVKGYGDAGDGTVSFLLRKD